MSHQPIVCWTEIPVSDLEKASRFYADVFHWTMTITPAGPNDIAVFDGADGAAGGHLYPGKPAKGCGTTVHLTTPDGITATAARLERAGGQVLGPVVDIPAGRFQYATDLDGNSIGLFEPGAT
jgi:predicted enzyme related to lactoylglutathione lyase